MNLTFETARAQSELFAFQFSQWELIWNSELIARYKEMSPGESYIWSMRSMRAHLKQSTNRKISRNVTRWILQYNPPFETGRAQSELFTFQCGQWELIWNSQLIGRYKEMSPGESYGQLDPIWNSKLMGRYKENVTRWILHLKLPEHRVNSSLFNVSQWELIWNSQLIGRYKEMSPGESYD